MKRIIQALVLAAVASGVQAAPGDAYPTGGAPLFLTAEQTYASSHARDAVTQEVKAFPTGGASLYLTAPQTHADRHAGEARAQSGDAFPSHGSAMGD